MLKKSKWPLDIPLLPLLTTGMRRKVAQATASIDIFTIVCGKHALSVFLYQGDVPSILKERYPQLTAMFNPQCGFS